MSFRRESTSSNKLAPRSTNSERAIYFCRLVYIEEELILVLYTIIIIHMHVKINDDYHACIP